MVHIGLVGYPNSGKTTHLQRPDRLGGLPTAPHPYTTD